MKERTLFDDDEDDGKSSWQEVPQKRFLSWSAPMQFAYCAARDEDSAMYGSTPEEIEWFLARAREYRRMSHECR